MKPFLLVDHCGTCGQVLRFTWVKDQNRPVDCYCPNETCADFSLKYKPMIFVMSRHSRLIDKKDDGK